jgi:putative ABC transport system permease protein
MNGLFQDLRFALRQLRKHPGFAAVSIGTLALAIGASTTIFSAVYGVLLRSLPYYQPDRIVQMWEVTPRGDHIRFADPNFEDMRAQAHSFQGVAEMYSDEVTATIGNNPERLHAAHVSRDFFAVMGVQPVIGRFFAPEDQHVGASLAALVSYSFWRFQLNGASDLSTVKFSVSNQPVSIIGVLPAGFGFPDQSQVWIARETDIRLPSRTAHNWQVVARLRDGVSLDQARADASAIGHRLYEQYGAEDMDMIDAAVSPLREALTADVRPALLVLFGVVGLLLLVSCANAGSLSLAQASARRGELAIRSALGVSRWRLVRQFLEEALLLSTLGSCLGVALAHFGIRALVSFAPGNIPRLDEAHLNLPVLGFAVALCLVMASGLGLLTAFRVTSGNVQKILTEAGRTQATAAHTQRMGQAIVAGQVAITLAMLVGAGLLAHSMLRVLSVRPGFETQNVLTINLKLPDIDGSVQNRRVEFLDRFISRLQTLPGVLAVGGANGLPLASEPDDGNFALLNPQQLSEAQRSLIDRSAYTSIEKADPAFLKQFTAFFTDLFRNPERTGNADYVVASAGYFQSLQVPLLRGRLFNDADVPDAPDVAVISESAARQKWPNQDPIGQTIEFGNMDGDLRPLTIIGVVGEVRDHSLEAAPRPTIYVSYRQRPRATSDFNIVIRTASEPAIVFAGARRILAELDPSVPPKFDALSEIVSNSLSRRRFNLLLVGTFAGSALLLALAGVFGLLAYSVAQRTREIGVRIALGATPGNVLAMVLLEGLATAASGVVIGLITTLLLTKYIRSLLFEVGPADLTTLTSAVALLVLVTVLASYIPACRAAKVDPMVALRYE